MEHSSGRMLELLNEIMLFAAYAYAVLPAFVFSPSCNCCEVDCSTLCNNCADLNQSATIQVTLAGWGNDTDCTNSNCTAVNGSWVLTTVSGQCGHNLNPRSRSITSGLCTTNGYLYLGVQFLGTNSILVFVLIQDGGTEYGGSETYTSYDFEDTTWDNGDNCCDWVNRNIPFSVSNGANPITTHYCDHGTVALTNL